MEIVYSCFAESEVFSKNVEFLSKLSWRVNVYKMLRLPPTLNLHPASASRHLGPLENVHTRIHLCWVFSQLPGSFIVIPISRKMILLICLFKFLLFWEIVSTDCHIPRVSRPFSSQQWTLERCKRNFAKNTKWLLCQRYSYWMFKYSGYTYCLSGSLFFFHNLLKLLFTFLSMFELKLKVF